ncbi:MAG: hypothetical protein IKD39_08810, partial [Oscillospiraceae bacterium]|nr:hypothetical protein [Oscillospiraceae bacterium]
MFFISSPPFLQKKKPPKIKTFGGRIFPQSFVFLGVNAPQKNFPRIVDILARAFGKNLFSCVFCSTFSVSQWPVRTANKKLL